MVRKILLVITCSTAVATMGQQYTNVMQVLNTPLSTECMNQITTDFSTPDRLFLSFLKSSTQGDLPVFLSLFTDACLASEFGVTDKNGFTNEDMADFQRFVSDNSVTNKTLVAYSCAISGDVATVTARIKLCTASRLIDEDIGMSFIQTNEAWRISQWQ